MVSQTMCLARAKRGNQKPPFRLTSPPGAVRASREELECGLRRQEVRSVDDSISSTPAAGRRAVAQVAGAPPLEPVRTRPRVGDLRKTLELRGERQGRAAPQHHP